MSRNNDRQIYSNDKVMTENTVFVTVWDRHFAVLYAAHEAGERPWKLQLNSTQNQRGSQTPNPNYLPCLQPFLTDLSSLPPLQSKWQSFQRITMGTIVLRFKARTKITTLCRLRRLPKLTIVPWRLKQRKGLTTKQREKKEKIWCNGFMFVIVNDCVSLELNCVKKNIFTF